MFSGDYLRPSKEEHYGRVMKLKKKKNPQNLTELQALMRVTRS